MHHKILESFFLFKLFFLSLNSCQTCKNLKNFILFIFHHHQKSELKRVGRGDLINSLNENFSRLFSANSTFQKLYKKAYQSKKKKTENNFQWEKFFSIIAVKKSEKMNGMERERDICFHFAFIFLILLAPSCAVADSRQNRQKIMWQAGENYFSPTKHNVTINE